MENAAVLRLGPLRQARALLLFLCLLWLIMHLSPCP